MCGISGYWLTRPLAPADAESLLRHMTEAVAHRGPDDSGLLYERSIGVGLGHRRLSIIDLSPAGHQPMQSASGRHVIVFNGEVYNFAELRRELDAHGPVAWRGTSDTEVMLAAIERFGLVSALERFVGMFAFALWDREERQLHLVRDRFGIKPLYWAHGPTGLCFGSELKSLTRFPGFDRSIDREALESFLLRGYVPAPKSIFKGAQKVPPGCLLTFAAGATEPRRVRWWSAAQVAVAGVHHPWEGTEDEAVDALDVALRDAVKARMVADVPLGAFLSGGVDSSTVVALMQAQSARPALTFSIANEQAAWDEAPAAARVAKHLGTDHTQLTVTARDALDVIPRLPEMYDEPFADSSQIPTFLVSRLARQRVTVALSGDGGDELFGGYNRHFWGPAVWYAEASVPRALRRRLADALTARSPAEWDDVYARFGRLAPRVRLPGYRVHKLAGTLASTSVDALYRTMTTQWPRAPLAEAPAARPTWDERLFWAEPPLDGIAHQFMYRDTVSYLADDILAKVDRATMAVGLEGREPLLDHRVYALAWRMPLKWTVGYGEGKRLLRRVLARYVPAELIEGPKMGFGVPLGDWLRGDLREWLEDLLSESRLRRQGLLDPALIRASWTEHLNGIRPNEHQLWNVLMFQAWLEKQQEDAPRGPRAAAGADGQAAVEAPRAQRFPRTPRRD